MITDPLKNYYFEAKLAKKYYYADKRFTIFANREIFLAAVFL